jgi:hypothetical protein
MSRALITIRGEAERKRAAAWAMQAPTGCRIEFKQTKRTLDQNSKLWVLLTEIARQATLHDRKFTPDQWKIIFMRALGKEVELLPALEGDDFIPIFRSSDLSKDEMSSLIELIMAWGAENNIQFNDPADEGRAA